jgi:hypothetical protein
MAITETIGRAAAAPSGPGPAPDAAEVARIVGLADPVARNLQITLGYHRLSRALGRRLGPPDADWCAFATWASKRAGQSIRGEDLPELHRRLRERLERDPAYRLARRRVAARLRDRGALVALGAGPLAARVLELVRAVGALAAEGNLLVFAELAPAFAEFARLPAAPAGDGRLDPQQLRGFLARFRPGATSAGGQDLLREAFTHYGEALAEPDPRARAELVLLANVQVGLHEQTRLQPAIAGALDAPMRWLRDRLSRDVAARLPPWKRPPVRLAGRWLLAPVSAVVPRVWRAEATRYLMHLQLPGERLGLGKDVPSRPGRPMFPAPLQDLRHPDLLALLRRLDRTWGTTAGSGAGDWADLGDRMHYIADLFRARQQEPGLGAPPFSPDQCRAILAGSVPAGPL